MSSMIESASDNGIANKIFSIIEWTVAFIVLFFPTPLS